METVETSLKEVCEEIGKRYEMTFIEIGADEDHVHFLVQSVPIHSPKRLIQIIKSITARELLQRHPEITKSSGEAGSGRAVTTSTPWESTAMKK